MRILGLCNPQSGGKPERLGVLKHFAHSVTGASVQMKVAASESMEQAEALLHEAQLGAADVLVVSGGDGTIAHACSWLLHGATSDSNTGLPTIALLPAGSTNMTAFDINMNTDWQRCLDTFLGHLDTSGVRPTSLRPLVDVTDGDRCHAGFFVGAGAIVRGIEYCNDVLWAGGAARQERTAGLAMVRTIWGVLRQQPPFDQVEKLSICAAIEDGSERAHEPESGALLFATSTLDRLVVGVRPFWGEQNDGALPYVLVDREAKLARNLPGLLGVPGFRRPVASRGFHSHNCAAVVLKTQSAYAIDGELFVPQTGKLELSASKPLRFLAL